MKRKARKEKKYEKGKIGKLQKVVHEKPGLAFAVAFSIVIVLAFAFLLSGALSVDQEEFEYARSLFEQNQFTIEAYLQDAETQLQEEHEDVLEDDFLHSWKDDLEWLKQKELEIYYSAPRNELYLREYVFSFLFIAVDEINDPFIFMLESDYDKTINNALASELKQLELFHEEDYEYEDLPAIDVEEANRLFNEMLKEYVSEKKKILVSDAPKERKYVDAKKILQVAFIELE